MKKKIMSCVLCLALLINLFPINSMVFAVDAGTATYTITADKTTAHPGDTITYTIKLQQTGNVVGIEAELDIPEGLEYVTGSGTVTSGLKDTWKWSDLDISETSIVKITGYGSESVTTTDQIILATFQCTVKEDATINSNYTVGLKNVTTAEYIDWQVEKTSTTVPAVVKVEAVPVPATGIDLDQTTLSLSAGANAQLTATVEPTTSTDTVTWSTSDANIATVANGLVTALAEGTATITATTTSGQTATCTVTVTCAHNYTEVAEVPTTHTGGVSTPGTKAHFKCTICNKLFVEVDGNKVPATAESLVIPAPEHTYSDVWQSDSTNHWKQCSVCGAKKDEVAHTEITIRDNEVPATCSAEGHYDEVVKCSVCNKELSRTNNKTIAKLDHTPATPVEENRVEPKHENGTTTPGSYDEVVYCSVCTAEISRVQKTIPAPEHTYGDWENDATNHWRECGCGNKITEAHQAGTPTRENINPATCTADGSYDEVVKCSTCGYEMSRTHKVETATGHTEGAKTKENVKPATCTEKGSYIEVTHCAKCNIELGREDKEIEAKGHTPGEPVKENEVPATTQKEGSYDEVVYCTECDEELSRESKTTPKFVYEMLEGMDGEHKATTEESLTFKSNGDFAKFTGVKVDGVVIEESNYTAEAGSTIVTLKAEYLNTLSAGTHKIAMVYTDGEIDTDFTIAEKAPVKDVDKVKPNTGDNSNMVMWISGLLISGICLIVISKWKTNTQKRTVRKH